MNAVTKTRRRVVEPGLEKALVGAEWVRPCTECAERRHQIDVNGIRFDVLDAQRFVVACEQFLACGGSHVVHFLAVHPTVAARQCPEYADLLNSGDLVVADGSPIAAMMFLRNRRARRLTSTDAFLRLCELGQAEGLKHYFVGGSSHDVAAAFQAALRLHYPEIEIAGHEVPPFRSYDSDELSALAGEIRGSRADVVWVGIGAPKQEILAHRLRMHNAAPVIACIGATFDFVAGTKSRAPWLMRALGLEWVFRLMLEPKRLWRRYLIGNAEFVRSIVLDELRRPSKGSLT